MTQSRGASSKDSVIGWGGVHNSVKCDCIRDITTWSQKPFMKLLNTSNNFSLLLSTLYSTM